MAADSGAVQATQDAVSTDMHGAKPSRAYAASRITNGNSILAGVDGRSREARRYRDILDGLLLESGTPTESSITLARRAAGLAVQIEIQEAKQARGESVDAAALTTNINALRRLLSDLGLSTRQSRRRAVTPLARVLSGVAGQ